MGDRLGRYVVLKHLASGGMADVLLARTDGIEGFARHVVLKRIKPEHARDQRFMAMFLDEARLAANLHHGNIVQVFDIGESNGEYFFAMEYLHGEDLRAILSMVAKQRQNVPLAHVIGIIAAAAAGLHHAHERRGPDKRSLGIVHRDVSPSNILIGFDGTPKLVDFGIAKAAARGHETRSGTLKGKVAYMSPEQCKSEQVDRRSDVYALGVVLYELATTTRLFKGESDYLVMDAICNGKIPLPRVRRPELPNELSVIIMKALATDPARRYQTADELRIAVEQFATSYGLSTSTSGLADYMHKLFGDKPEPWLDDTTADERGSFGSGAEGRRGSIDERGSSPFGSGAEGRRGSIDERGSSPFGSGAEGRRGSIDERGSSPRAKLAIAVPASLQTPRAPSEAQATELGRRSWSESAPRGRSPSDADVMADGTQADLDHAADEPKTITDGTLAQMQQQAAAQRPVVRSAAITNNLPAATPKLSQPMIAALAPAPATRTSTKMAWEPAAMPSTVRSSSSPSSKIAASIVVALVAVIGVAVWKLALTPSTPGPGPSAEVAAQGPAPAEPPEPAEPPAHPAAAAAAPVEPTPAAAPIPSAPVGHPPSPAAPVAPLAPLVAAREVTVRRPAIPAPAHGAPLLAAAAPPIAAPPVEAPKPEAPVTPAPVAPPPVAPAPVAPAPVAPAPMVIEAPPMAHLSDATVQAVARDHGAELAKCEGDGLRGEITVHFQIDAGGRVTKKQLSSTVGKAKIAGCILATLARWQFPRPPSGSADGTYTLSFQ